MALVLRGTHHRVASITHPALTRIRLCTRVQVITNFSVILRRIRARARRRVTRSGNVTLILCRTHHVITSRTRSALACIRLRAQVTVVTRDAVILRGIRTDTRRGVTRSG